MYHLNFRYRSYYVHILVNIDAKYPGMREYLKIGGISAQAHTKHAVRTATDQRGEQAINKDAKITGNLIWVFTIIYAFLQSTNCTHRLNAIHNE